VLRRTLHPCGGRRYERDDFRVPWRAEVQLLYFERPRCWLPDSPDDASFWAAVSAIVFEAVACAPFP